MTKEELVDGLIAGGWAAPAATVEWLFGEIAEASFGRLSRDSVEEIVLANGEELLDFLLACDAEDVSDVLDGCPAMKAALGFAD